MALPVADNYPLTPGRPIYAGRYPPTDPLEPPAWLPAPGHSGLVPELRTYIQARPPTAVGTRGFTRGWRREILTPTYQAPAYQTLGWTNFSWSSVIDAFSGGVYNPYYQHTPGRFGCLFFHGGGHSATNWNGIAGFDFNSGDYFIAHPGSEMIWPLPEVMFADPGNTHVDQLTTEGLDGQPGAPHSYDTMVVLGPDQGYPQGALVTCVRASYFHSNASSPAVHLFDCANMHLGWQLKWAPPDGSWKIFTSGYASTLDPVRNVVWTVGGGPTGLCKYDIATGVQTKQNNISPGRFSGVHPESHVLRHVPGRDILLYSCSDYPVTLRMLQWLNPANTAAGWKTATLATALPADVHPLGLCWVPPKNAFYARCKGYTQQLFKIELPTVLTDPWAITNVPFEGPPMLDLSPTGPGTLGRRFEWSEPLGAIVFKGKAADQMMVYVPD